MPKIFAVSSGEYSDYRVNALFSTQEKAQDYINLICQAGEIEEYELDIPLPPPGHACWTVIMTVDGEQSVLSAPLTAGYCSPDDREPTMGHAPWPPFNGKQVATFSYVLARTEEHAVKICAERRAQLVASGRWEELKKGRHQK